MPMELFHIEFRIDGVEVSAVQSVLHQSEGFAETLEMNDFTFSEEANRVDNIRVVGKTKNVVVGQTGFLFCCNHIRTTF